MEMRSLQGKPGSAGRVEIRFRDIAGAGEPEECPRYTRTPAAAMNRDCIKNEQARTQRLVSPNLRWNDAVATAPRKKATMETTDFVQASRGDDTGRSETPSAAKIVLPVY